MSNNEWAVQRRGGPAESRANNVIYIGRASFRMEPAPLSADEIDQPIAAAQAIDHSVSALDAAHAVGEDIEPPYLRLRTLVDESLVKDTPSPQAPELDLTEFAVLAENTGVELRGDGPPPPFPRTLIADVASFPHAMPTGTGAVDGAADLGEEGPVIFAHSPGWLGRGGVLRRPGGVGRRAHDRGARAHRGHRQRGERNRHDDERAARGQRDGARARRGGAGARRCPLHPRWRHRRQRTPKQPPTEPALTRSRRSRLPLRCARAAAPSGRRAVRRARAARCDRCRAPDRTDDPFASTSPTPAAATDDAPAGARRSPSTHQGGLGRSLRRIAAARRCDPRGAPLSVSRSAPTVNAPGEAIRPG